MAEQYFCESCPIAVSYSISGGHTGAVGEALGGSEVDTSATIAAQGSTNAIMRYYAGPTLGFIRGYSGSVNGTTTLYVVDNGPTLGMQLSAT